MNAGQPGASAMQPVIVEVGGLTKRFAAHLALDHVTLQARRGEILGILGPNGAGKSTLIGILSGLVTPDSGEIRLFGKPVPPTPALRARMNLCSPYAGLPGQLKVREYLAFYAGLYGIRRPATRIAELLERFGIAHLAGGLCSRLSSGQSVRVGLCKALLNQPELLLLDEPTVYLDNDSAEKTRRLILQERQARGMTILLTSHNLAEIEALCDRIVLLSGGRVIACGTALEITRRVLGQVHAAPDLGAVFRRLASVGPGTCAA